MSLIDKSDLFFHDYSLAPLFVQENYVHVKPAAAGWVTPNPKLIQAFVTGTQSRLKSIWIFLLCNKVNFIFSRGNLKKHLVLLSRAADSICDGDIVDRQIRSKQNWNLLPTQVSTFMFFKGCPVLKVDLWRLVFQYNYMIWIVHTSCSILFPLVIRRVSHIHIVPVLQHEMKCSETWKSWTVTKHRSTWCVSLVLLQACSVLPLTRTGFLSKHRGLKLGHCTFNAHSKHWQDLCLMDYDWHQRMHCRWKWKAPVEVI